MEPVFQTDVGATLDDFEIAPPGLEIAAVLEGIVKALTPSMMRMPVKIYSMKHTTLSDDHA